MSVLSILDEELYAGKDWYADVSSMVFLTEGHMDWYGIVWCASFGKSCDLMLDA
jgi:hypothetical protein